MMDMNIADHIPYLGTSDSLALWTSRNSMRRFEFCIRFVSCGRVIAYYNNILACHNNLIPVDMFKVSLS